MFNKFIERPVLSIVISDDCIVGCLAMTHFTSYAITFISPKVNITAEYPEQIMNY
jgi:hypothetical protein